MHALALLLTLIAVSDDPPPLRGHDPYVFRCTLDGKPRMLVIALSPGWWMAFDTQTCTIYKVWEGDVDFTGTVYDTRHGPQPAARGDMILQSRSEPLARAANAKNSDPWISNTTNWRGYRIDSAGNVVLMFDILPAGSSLPARVELSPTFQPTSRRGGRLSIDIATELPEDLDVYFGFQPLERTCTPISDYHYIMASPFRKNSATDFSLVARRGVTQWRVEIQP
jgi:hypothetical protein